MHDTEERKRPTLPRTRDTITGNFPLVLVFVYKVCVVRLAETQCFNVKRREEDLENPAENGGVDMNLFMIFSDSLPFYFCQNVNTAVSVHENISSAAQWTN